MANPQRECFQTVADVVKKEAKKSRPKFVCPSLDHTFGPAIRPGHVIEITGEAGAGKSQFLLNLLAGAPNSSSNQRSLVISTEGLFSAERLQQMIASSGKSELAMDQILVDNVTALVRTKCS